MSRILHVPRRFALDEWGGTESVIYNLCKQQQALGQHPEIHTSRALAPIPREVWRDIPIRRYRYCYPFLGLSEAEVICWPPAASASIMPMCSSAWEAPF
jgi:hypothetical protein